MPLLAPRPWLPESSTPSTHLHRDPPPSAHSCSTHSTQDAQRATTKTNRTKSRPSPNQGTQLRPHRPEPARPHHSPSPRPFAASRSLSLHRPRWQERSNRSRDHRYSRKTSSIAGKGNQSSPTMPTRIWTTSPPASTHDSERSPRTSRTSTKLSGRPSKGRESSTSTSFQRGWPRPSRLVEHGRISGTRRYWAGQRPNHARTTPQGRQEEPEGRREALEEARERGVAGILRSVGTAGILRSVGVAGVLRSVGIAGCGENAGVDLKADDHPQAFEVLHTH